MPLPIAYDEDTKNTIISAVEQVLEQVREKDLPSLRWEWLTNRPSNYSLVDKTTEFVGVTHLLPCGRIFTDFLLKVSSDSLTSYLSFPWCSPGEAGDLFESYFFG
mgnify:CR=1 FL=1